MPSAATPFQMSNETEIRNAQPVLIPDNLLVVIHAFRAGDGRHERLFEPNTQWCYTSSYEKEVLCGPCGNKFVRMTTFYVVVIEGVEYHMSDDNVAPTRIVLKPEDQVDPVAQAAEDVRIIEGEEVYQPQINLDRFNKVVM